MAITGESVILFCICCTHGGGAGKVFFFLKFNIEAEYACMGVKMGIIVGKGIIYLGKIAVITLSIGTSMLVLSDAKLSSLFFPKRRAQIRINCPHPSSGDCMMAKGSPTRHCSGCQARRKSVSVPSPLSLVH